MEDINATPQVPQVDQTEGNTSETQTVNLDLGITDEDLANPLDTFSTQPIATFDKRPEIQVAPMLAPQLELTADMVNSLGATSRYANMEDMRRAFNDEVHGGPLDEALKTLQSMEGSRRKAAIMGILNRTDLLPEERLTLIAEIEKDGDQPDQNIIERNVLAREASAEHTGYDDETEASFVEAMRYVAEVPRILDASKGIQPEAEVDKEEMRQAYEQFLAMQITEAQDRQGVVNFLPNFLPFYAAVPISKMVQRMNALTGEDMSVTQAALLNGTAIRQMRERIEGMTIEQKTQFLGEVLRVLKPNGGVMYQDNAWLKAYTLQSLFYKDATGEEFIKFADEKTQKAYIKATTDADSAKRHRLAAKTPEEREMWLRRQVEAETRANQIDRDSDGRLWKDAALPTWTGWLDDMAILDFMMIGPLARGTVKLGKKGGMAAFRKLTNVAPDATTRLAVNALTDPKVRARLGQLLGPDIAETFLPAAIRGADEAGINGMGELIERTNRLQAEIFRARVEGTSITANMQNAFRQELEATLGTTKRAALHLDKSVFEIGEDGISYIVRYGRTSSKPFAQLGTARKALADMPGHARVVQLMPNGKYKVAGDVLKDTKRGQFFVAYGDKRMYDSSRTLWETAVFDRAQVRDPWWLRSSVVPMAKLWNWFLPTDSMFGKTITNEVVGQTMRSPVIQRLQAGLVTNLLTMPRHEQQVVSALMKQGEEMGTVFTVQQIKTMFPKISDRAVKGYYESRTLADNMYEMANTQQRTEWFRSGVKQIVGSTGRLGFGKLLAKADDAVGDIKAGYSTLHVFDPETGLFQVLHRGDIDALYKQGKSLARMEDLVQGPKWQEATHILVDGKKTMVKPLPRRVLPKVPGYYPHIFQGNFVVYGVSAAGNKVAISVAKTIADAKTEAAKIGRVMQRMTAAGKQAPYQTISYQFDRSLRDPLVHSKDVVDPIFGATSKVYGTRSGHMLRNASRAYGDHMVDPIEALLRGMELVSHSVTKGNLIKHMEQRLLNTAKLMERVSGERVVKDPRRMIKTADDINYVASLAKDHRKLLAYMQQIDMVRHIPDAVERHMAIALTWGAEMFDAVATKVMRVPLLGKPTAKVLDTVGGGLVSAATKGTDPTRLLTEFAHRVYIAANPIQQFALQMSQASLVLGIAPRQLPKSISQSVPIAVLLYNRMNMPQIANFNKLWPRLLKGASKLTGIPEPVLDKLVGVMERSGLVDSVAMHTQIRTTARSAAMARQLATASAVLRNTPGRVTMDALGKLDEATFGTLSKIGFEAGEQYNRIITFLSLYHRDVRKGLANLDSPAYVQKIVGETNTLVGSMLRETNMGYQRGWLKAAFQFVAFQHKMAAMTLTNKNLSWAQKGAIALTQFSLFGSRSAFHLDAAHRAFDSWINDYAATSEGEKSKMVELYYAPETQRVLNGIVFDYGVNTILRMAAGDDTPEFAWNRRIAPGGGSEMMVDTLLELRGNPTEKIFGLSADHGSKVVAFVDQLYRVVHAQSLDMDDVPVEERVKMLTKEGLSLAFSGYDKYLAAAAAQEMGGWVTDTGNIVEASDSGLEFALAAALGLNTKDREAYYDATDKLYADIRNDPKQHEAALDAIANQMFERMIDESVKFSEQAPDHDVYLSLQGKEIQNRALLLSFLTRPEQERVSDKIGNKVAELVRGRRTPAQEVFYRNLVRELESGGLMDDDILKWDAYMKHSPLFQQYPQLQSDFQSKIRELTETGEE